jgi:hypothetical protein
VLLLEGVELSLFAGEFLLPLVGRVLLFLGPSLQVAEFVASGIHFTVDFFTAAGGFIAGTDFRFTDNLVGIAASLVDEFLAASFGEA